MDNICVWLERLSAWIDRNPLPPLPYAGPAGNRFYNPPAPHLEIALVLDGGFEHLRLGDRVEQFPKNHISLHSVHFGNVASKSAPGTRSWCLFFDVSGGPFPELDRAPLFSLLPLPRPERLLAAMEKIAVRCALQGAPPPRYLTGPLAYDPARPGVPARTALHIKAAVLEFLAFFQDEAFRHGSGERPADSPAVDDAIEFMGRRYGDPALALADIAAAAHLSVDHFGRAFRQRTGATPVSFLRTLRIDQARLLLRQTTLTVREVAFHVGFSDPLHFSRVFRNLAGITPTDFRNQAGVCSEALETSQRNARHHDGRYEKKRVKKR